MGFLAALCRREKKDRRDGRPHDPRPAPKRETRFVIPILMALPVSPFVRGRRETDVIAEDFGHIVYDVGELRLAARMLERMAVVGRSGFTLDDKATEMRPSLNRRGERPLALWSGRGAAPLVHQGPRLPCRIRSGRSAGGEHNEQGSPIGFDSRGKRAHERADGVDHAGSMPSSPSVARSQTFQGPR